MLKFPLVILLAVLALPPCCAAQQQDRTRQAAEQAAPRKKKPTVPQPRAVAVLEWAPESAPKSSAPAMATTPEQIAKMKAELAAVPVAKTEAPSKDAIPKEARLIPVSIFYQGAYQDAGVYLSQPTPLALQSGNVYELEKAGDPAGTFTVHTTSRAQNAWVAFGDYKPVPPPKAVVPNVNIVLGPNADDEEGDRPVLRRHHADATTPATASASPVKQETKDAAPIGADDEDRPKLKHNDTPAPANTTPSQPPAAANPPAQPVSGTERKTSDNYLDPADDASRPHIKKGIYNEPAPALPSLVGHPENLRQTVAVSDAQHTDDHPFTHEWNNDGERQRAQQAMQDLTLKQIAAWQKALPSANAGQPKAKSPVRKTSAKQKTSQPTLTDVQFAAYDLAYQDEPTYVFTAQSMSTGASPIYVAVVARPDIYGNLQTVFSAVTDDEDLGLTPRYRLVDAVDAKGDGRANLLLEARNADGRRFVLLDVYRGQAEKVFETGLIP